MAVLTRDRMPHGAGTRQILTWRSRWRVLLETRLVWVVLAAYLLFRLFSVVLVSWIATTQNPDYVPFGTGGDDTSYWDMTRMWDGRWYETIVQDGYPGSLPHGADGKVEQNPWAFYPLYPLITKALMFLTGGSFGVVGSLLSLAFGAAGVCLMAVLLRPRIGAAAALAVTCAFSASPPSPVLQMTYTESLSLLLLMGFLILISRQSWLGASGLAILCGLARPIAVPLGLVALVAVVMRWRVREERPIDRTEGGQMILSLVSCGLAGLLWPAIAWAVTGVPSAYTQTEVAWRLDDTVVPFVPWLHNFQMLFGDVWGVIWLIAVVVALLVMTCGPWSVALGPELRTWTLGYAVYIGAVVAPWTSIYRFMLFIFPVLAVLIGVGHPDRRRRVLVWTRTVCLVGLFLGWQVWWAWTLLRLDQPAGFAI